jgi:hypothetical protein
MNRREAIIAGVAGITVAAAVAPTADAQSSQAANPELEQIRALLRAHDEALTVEKKDGKWLIAAMHFSTLTGDSATGTKDTQ